MRHQSLQFHRTADGDSTDSKACDDSAISFQLEEHHRLFSERKEESFVGLSRHGETLCSCQGVSHNADANDHLCSLF